MRLLVKPLEEKQVQRCMVGQPSDGPRSSTTAGLRAGARGALGWPPGGRGHSFLKSDVLCVRDVWCFVHANRGRCECAICCNKSTSLESDCWRELKLC